MQKRIELTPKADIGKGYALIDETGIEIRISGVMGALKVWLIGNENKPVGNVVGGRFVYKTEMSPFCGVLITQSGKQMFYGSWRDFDINSEGRFPPLGDFGWEKITSRAYPCTDEGVKAALSNTAFFEAFKKHGYYLFGKDGESFALAVKHLTGDPSPFPGIESAKTAGEYVYAVFPAAE